MIWKLVPFVKERLQRPLGWLRELRELRLVARVVVGKGRGKGGRKGKKKGKGTVKEKEDEKVLAAIALFRTRKEKENGKPEES